MQYNPPMVCTCVDFGGIIISDNNMKYSANNIIKYLWRSEWKNV